MNFNPSPEIKREVESILSLDFLRKELPDCEISLDKEPQFESAYILGIKFPKLNTGIPRVTVRYVVENNGKDFVITNLTTMPHGEDFLRKGYASKVISSLVTNIISSHKEINIIATQVSDSFDEGVSKSFWIKNGFIEKQGKNITGDFEFVK